MSRTDFLYARSPQFQRGDGRGRIKKATRKISLRLKHVLLSLGLMALLFFAVYKIYSFLISWRYLDIRDVQVTCSDQAVQERIAQTDRRLNWGNILLLDILKVQRRLETDSWIKEARVRKSFPSALKIDIIARKPAALLQRETVVVIDQEGAELENADRIRYPELPLLVDDRRFIQDYPEKIALAWECLNGLPAEEKSRIDILDVSDPRNAVLQFRTEPTRLFLGVDLFGIKIAEYRKNKDRWESSFGELEYVDLRFPDRIYIKPRKTAPEKAAALKSNKEAE